LIACPVEEMNQAYKPRTCHKSPKPRTARSLARYRVDYICFNDSCENGCSPLYESRRVTHKFNSAQLTAKFQFVSGNVPPYFRFLQGYSIYTLSSSWSIQIMLLFSQGLSPQSVRQCDHQTVSFLKRMIVIFLILSCPFVSCSSVVAAENTH
jgi:hypothetical protein